MMTKECFFCGILIDSKSCSKEHKVPKWLQAHLDIEKIPIDFEPTSHDGISLTKRTYSLSSDVSKIICKNCNNGWMSKLENQSLLILKNLFEDRCNLVSLSHTEKIILSCWLTKTAYVFLSATEFASQIPKDHTLYLMRENATPPNVYVVGTRVLSSEKIGRSANFRWQTFPPIKSGSENEKICKESYKIGLHFANYFFLISYFPLTDWRLGLDHRYYIPLAGEKEKIVWLRTESPGLMLIKNPKDGLNAYVDSAMAVSEKIIVSRPNLTDLSGRLWRIV